MKKSTWLPPVAAFLAALVAGEWFGHEVAFGLVAALAVAGWARLQARVNALQARLDAARVAGPAVGPAAQADAQRDALASPTGAAASLPVPVPVPLPTPEAAEPAEPTSIASTTAAAPSTSAPVTADPAAPARAPALEPDERSARVTASLGASLKAWFTGGNTIVRAAVLILFVGVAFLVRYAAEHALLPIELRLAGAVAGGMAMVVAGWRLRLRRPGYGLTLQGGGVGVIYLVLFAAFRLYGLVPGGLAFALLVALGGLTAWLALRQDALPLAALAFAGGFLAPVLTSTGGGSHVALFSYYLVLNLAIAWLAQHRAWKLLNAMGFVFTFGIGIAWGLKHWQPALLASTEPFLVAHLLLYLFITVQYSKRLLAAQDDRLPLVDGGLLFGVPIAAFGAQAAMVRHLDHGVAISAAVMAAIYLLLTRWLWRQAGERLRVLAEGLFALGVVFLALVAPLALDGRWTAAAWALQGAGVMWVALRQRRAVALGLGLALQLMGGLMFWGGGTGRDAAAGWMLNAHLVGALLLAAAALFSARQLMRQQALAAPVAPDAAGLPAPAGRRSFGLFAPATLQALHWMLLGAGVLHALGGVAVELAAAPWQVPDGERLVRLWLALAAVLLELAARRLAWPAMAAVGRGLIGLALAVSALAMLQQATGADAGWAGWRDAGVLEWLLLAAAGLWMLARRDRGTAPPAGSVAVEHLVSYAHALVGAATLTLALAQRALPHDTAWTPALTLAAPLLLMGLLLARQRAGRWPSARHGRELQLALGWPLLALACVTLLALDLLADGSMRPLPYLPLANPVDLAHGLVLVYGLRLAMGDARPPQAHALLRPLAGVLVFAWLNALVVRSLHHWAGTPMWTDGALGAGTVQTSLSLLWTLCALGAMFIASRRAQRALWMAGAALLGAVVVKLLLVDLSHTGALLRIVSFIGVGLLMLVIGYLSPLPPAAGTARPAKEAA